MTDEQQLKQNNASAAEAAAPQQSDIGTAEMDIRLAHHIEKKVKPKSEKV